MTKDPDDHPPPMAPWPAWLKTYLPIIVGTAVALTLGAFVNSLGILGLVLIWMMLALVVLGVYALLWRGETLKLRKARDEASRPASETTPRSVQPTQEDAMLREMGDALIAAKEEIKVLKQARDTQKEARLKAEQALEESKRERSKITLLPKLPGEVILSTDLVVGPDQFADFVSKHLRRQTVIEVLAESSERFSIFVFDSENMRRYMESRRNTESLAGKKNVGNYRERIIIPRGDDWFFVVEPAEEGGSAHVSLTISLVAEP